MNKAVLLTTDFPPLGGGIADFLHHICEQLGPDVTVLLPRASGDVEFDTRQPYQIMRLPVDPLSRWKRNLLLVPHWIRQAAPLIQRQGVQSVIGGFASPTILLALAYLRRRYAVTSRLIVHGGDILPLHLSPLRRILEVPLLKGVDIFIANSDFTRRVLTDTFHIRSERIKVLHPGVEYARFQKQGLVSIHNWPDSRKRILTVGRLVEHKGFDRVIEAVAQLIEQGMDVGYIIVGKGNDRSRLEKLASSLGISDNVHFAGFVPDKELPDYYHTCDVFTLLSRQSPLDGSAEGFGIVFLEAAACGKPVIGGRSGGVPDAVVHGKTGLLVEPTDVTEIAKTLHLLLTDVELARRLGENGRQRVIREFDWANRRAEVRKVFLEVINV